MTSCAKLAMSREPATRKMRASREMADQEGSNQCPMGWPAMWAGASAARATAASSASSIAPATARIMAGPLLRPRGVLARAGIALPDLALIDEQGHADHRAGLEPGGLLAAGGGVAAHTGVGLDHLQLDVRRRRDHQRHVVPQRDDAGDALLQPLGVFAHRLLAGGVLL